MVDRPGTRIYQDFNLVSSTEKPTMYSCIVGPRHDFLDYNDAEDKVKAYVGEYSGEEISFNFPDKYILSEVIDNTIKVILDDIRLKYFEKTAGDGVYDFRAIKKARNRLTTVADLDSQRLSFKEYTNKFGTTYSRSSIFDGRDVKTGDYVEISSVVGVSEYTTLAEVSGFVNENIEASIDDPEYDELNQATTSHSITETEDTGASGDTIVASGTYTGSLEDDVIEDDYVITVISSGGDPVIDAPVKTVDNGSNTATSGGSFDSLEDDTYTVEVIEGGAPLTAKLRVTSENGDDVEEVTFAAFASPQDVGSLGVTITIADDGSVSGELVLGDTWTIDAHASSGKLSIYSSSETDDVAERAFPGFGVAFSIGTRGALITVTDTSGNSMITLGDVFEINCVSAFQAMTCSSSGEFDHTSDLVYTVTVVKGGVWGKCYISATSTGVDSSGPYVVENHSVAIPVGTKGAEITYNTNTQGGLKEGDRVTIVANCAKYGAAKTILLSKNITNNILNADPEIGSATLTDGTGDCVATSGGTYDDSVVGALSKVPQEKYTVVITAGGQPGVGTPKYTVTSLSGLDDQEETSISAYSTDHTVGSAGVTISWVAGAVPTHFVLGDTWEIPVDGINLSVKLLLRKDDVDLGRYKEDIGFDAAWENDEEKVTLADDIKMSDDDWEDGEEFIPVDYAKVYVTYQAIRTDVVGAIQKLTSVDEIEAAVGPIHIYNPLAYALYKNLSNSGDMTVYYFPVASNDLAGYNAFLKLAENTSALYNLVPLTKDSAIRTAFINHIDKFSTAEEKKWRVGFFNSNRIDNLYLYEKWYKTNSTDEEDYTATVKDYIDTSDTDYLFVEASEEEGVNFIQSGVKEGDMYRTLFKTNSLGELEYTDIEIAGVISETTLLLKESLDAPINAAEKFQIYRKLTSSEMATEFAKLGTNTQNRRAHLIYPDYVTDDDGYVVDGYHLCAATAGLSSGTKPHQSLTNMSLVGFSDVPRSYIDMSQGDLDIMANGGIMIVTQKEKGTIPYIRHELTTDVRYVEYQQSSITKNVDNVAYYAAGILEPFIGKYNINTDVLEYIRTKILTSMEDLKTVESGSEEAMAIGPQLINFVIEKIYQLDKPNKDKIRIDAILTIPYPLNNIDVHLSI